jgi:hypothetical protein
MEIEFQGIYQIQSLSGSFMRRSGGMNVSLVDLDGNVVGGRVAGPLVAASPVAVSTWEGNNRSIKSNQILRG